MWQSLTTYLQRLTEPGSEPEVLRRKRLLVSTGWLFLGLTAFQLLLLALPQDAALRSMRLLPAAVAFGLAVAVLLLVGVFPKNTSLSGGLFVFGLGLIIAYTWYPVGITEDRNIFFFSIPIFFASGVIQPRASFWVAGYCAALLWIVPATAYGEAAAWRMYNSPAMLGFFMLAAFAWWVMQSLEQALARQREANSQLLTLVEQHEQLRRLDEEKNQLLFTVSHELRSPMTAIRLTLKQIVAADTPDRKLQLVRREIDRLTDLVQDLLSLARLEQQQPRLNYIPVDLNQVVAEVCTALDAAAQAKGLALAFEAAPDLPCIKGHPAQLIQVVHNLVGNAVSYTERGQVQVRTRVVPAPPQVALEVADTGVGIAPEDLPHIFERMFRGSRTSGATGTGLGLAIVQTIVTQHQGEITVQSTPGEGTVFTVIFPVWTAADLPPQG